MKIKKICCVKLLLLIYLLTSSVIYGCSVKVNSDIKNDRFQYKVEQLNNNNSKYILVAAHRGDWRNAPENSIQAIQNCIKMGVDIVEIDVRMTKDSVLVLMHDKLIDRTTTGSGKISNWTLDSLQTLFLKNGANHATKHRIPTLKEAMVVAKGKILVNLDKCSDYMDKAFKILEETETINQVIFKGDNDVYQVQKKYGTLLDKIIYMPIIRESTVNLEGHIADFLSENKPLAFEVIYKSDESIMFNKINTIKKHGCRVWVNTLWESLCGDHADDRAVYDPDGAWGWVIQNGANIIQTDRPKLLLEYLRDKGFRD